MLGGPPSMIHSVAGGTVIPANVTRYEEIYARHREIYPAARKILTNG